jgi:hypothetical protein
MYRGTFFQLASCPQNGMTYTVAVCTVKYSWWWMEELSKTGKVSFQNKIDKLVHLVGVIVRNLSRCTVTWTSKKNPLSFSSAIALMILREARLLIMQFPITHILQLTVTSCTKSTTLSSALGEWAIRTEQWKTCSYNYIMSSTKGTTHSIDVAEVMKVIKLY